MHSAARFVQSLADTHSLSSLLESLRARSSFEILDHWKQGEFHHDTIVRLPENAPARVIVVATNCNGGVKEVIAFREVPDRWALWHSRCPHVADFSPVGDHEARSGELPEVVARAITLHWFDPCALLTEDARSELRAEHRTRQRGGGWEPAG